MKLLEYEAKAILRAHAIPVPKGVVIKKGDDFTNIPLPTVVKSQVPIGGRGKAGGIKVVKNNNELAKTAKELFNLPIKGFTPHSLLCETLVDVHKEYYLSLSINRNKACIELLAQINGGVEVEANTGDYFTSELERKNIDGVGDSLADYLNIPRYAFVLQDLLQNLLDCFVKNDATLLEINPLILTSAGELIAGDCKMVLDDAASFRHPHWHFETAAEATNFVELNPKGTVATIANGAGLAMTTVDAVASAGLTPANFLDIGGGANEASVYAAFERIANYPKVKVIVINIFAGITRCDEVAKAIIAAKSRLKGLPSLSIRLAGTNYQAASELLQSNNIELQPTLESCIASAKIEVSQ